MAPITLRLPSASPLSHKNDSAQSPPSVDQLEGTWHVTHSTLPMWLKARNVRITYSKLSAPNSEGKNALPPLDDLVQYQGLDSPKEKSVRGVDHHDPEQNGWAWNWRGKGWLMIASSRWEILGSGDEEEGGGGNTWAVTYFAKTLFTPAGIDLYSREKKGLNQSTVEEIKKALRESEDEGVSKLAGEIFEIKMDAGN